MRTTWLKWTAVGLGAALVFATTAAVVQWRRADDLAHQKSLRDGATATAAAEAAALFTYDYRDLAAAQDRILGLATGEFARQEAAHSSAIARNLVRLRASGTASVREVALSAVTGGRALALVLVATRAQAVGGSTSGLVYLHMTLLLAGGRWKVAGVQTLASPVR